VSGVLTFLPLKSLCRDDNKPRKLLSVVLNCKLNSISGELLVQTLNKFVQIQQVYCFWSCSLL